MAEGPQVLLRTEWLRSWIGGRVAHLVESKRDDLSDQCRQATGRQVESVTCYGKHIFIDFGEDLVLHNHLLMKGRWRKYPGGFLFPPEQAWLVVDVGTCVVCNLEGQMLKWTDRSGREAVVGSLGPDTLKRPYPRDEITSRLRTSTLPISEALLDQTLLAGIGNTAKSEILYTAGLDPSRAAAVLTEGEWDRLHDRIAPGPGLHRSHAA